MKVITSARDDWSKRVDFNITVLCVYSLVVDGLLRHPPALPAGHGSWSAERMLVAKGVRGDGMMLGHSRVTVLCIQQDRTSAGCAVPS